MPQVKLIDKIIERINIIFSHNLCLDRFTREFKEKCVNENNIFTQGTSIKYNDTSIEFDIDLPNKELYFKEDQEYNYRELGKDIKTREIWYNERENACNFAEHTVFKAEYSDFSNDGELDKKTIINSSYDSNYVYKDNDIVFYNNAIRLDKQEKYINTDDTISTKFFEIKEIYYLNNTCKLRIENQNGDEKYFYCYMNNEKEITYIEAEDILKNLDNYKNCKVRKL